MISTIVFHNGHFGNTREEEHHREDMWEERQAALDSGRRVIRLLYFSWDTSEVYVITK